FNRFVRRILELALGPFALGLGIDTYAVVERIGGAALGVILGIAASLAAIYFWYIFEFSQRRAERKMRDQNEKAEATKLADKVDHVLAEARVVLPGAQALLGFQFAAILIEGFEKLEPAAKYLHLISL